MFDKKKKIIVALIGLLCCICGFFYYASKGDSESMNIVLEVVKTIIEYCLSIL